LDETTKETVERLRGRAELRTAQDQLSSDEISILYFSAADLITRLSERIGELERELTSLRVGHGGQLHISSLYNKALEDLSELRALSKQGEGS